MFAGGGGRTRFARSFFLVFEDVLKSLRMLKLLLHCYGREGKSKVMDLHPDFLLKTKIEQPRRAPVLVQEATWGDFSNAGGKNWEKTPSPSPHPRFGVLLNPPPNPQCRIPTIFGISGASS